MPFTPVPFKVAMLCEGALGVIALAVGWFLARPPLEQIDWTAEAVGLGLLAAVPLVAGLLVMIRYPLGSLKALEDVVEQLVLPLFRDCTLGQLLLISLLAGFGEELLFRGVIQAGVHTYSGSPWLALVIASLLFGLAHPLTVTYVVLAGLIGAYLGWLALATENLLVPIVTHAAYDFVALVYLLRRDPGDVAPTQTGAS